MAQKLFDIRKYQNELPTLVDGSDALANQKELVISFYHVPSKRSVFFKAFIEAFSETYSSNFTPTEAFGRTDPIYQYKNTTRKISLTFKIPAASEGEAYENLGRVSALEQMLYPSYTEVGSATTLSQAPLIRLKVMNLLQKTQTQNSIGDRKTIYESYGSVSDSALGVLGVIDNLSVDHNIAGDDGVFYKGTNTILPKNIQLSLGFSPIHETTLGWNKSDPESGASEQINNLFPYGAIVEETLFGLESDVMPSATERTQRLRDEELKRKAIEQMKANKAAGFADLKQRMGMLRTNPNNPGTAILNKVSTALEIEEALGDIEFTEFEEQFISDITG